jgi:ferritin
MHKLYNSQITNELSASQLYLAASIWCDEQELTGMASFTRAESSEERDHALNMIDFALKRDMPLKLEALDAPDANWESVEGLFSDLLEAEKSNSQALYMLADAAQASHDHAVTTFLMPFHSEQVDSEANLKTLLAKVREERQIPGLIRQLDYQLGSEARGRNNGM